MVRAAAPTRLAHEEVDHPPGKGCYWDEHQLARPDATIASPDWEWADVDRHRLVWTSAGNLFTGRLDESGIAQPTELHDFNGMAFEPIEAPY